MPEKEIVKRVVVLPIKCSTVRRLDARLSWLNDRLLEAAICAFVGWSITLTYRYMIAPESFTSGDSVYLLTSWAGCLIAAVLLLDYIVKRIPNLECIKDEPEDQ